MSIALSSIISDSTTTFTGVCPKATSPTTANNSTSAITTAYLNAMNALTILLDSANTLIGTYTLTGIQDFATLRAGAGGILSFTGTGLTIGRFTAQPPITVLGCPLTVGVFTRWVATTTSISNFLAGVFGANVSGTVYNFPIACSYPSGASVLAFTTPIATGVTMGVETTVSSASNVKIVYSGGAGNQAGHCLIIG